MTEYELLNKLDGINRKIRDLEIKQAIFLGGYFLFCLFSFLFDAYAIVNGDGLIAAISGAIQVYCLFLSACWIEELFND